MTSEKQQHANRANATKSTGPRSQTGKARSRLNAWKHGLSAKMLIILGEDADDFDQLRADLIKEHNPQSVLESELVERLAVILWRLRRVPCFEAAILDAGHQQVWNQKNYCLPKPAGEEKEEEKLDQEESDWERSVDLGLALMDGRYGDTLGKIERHENSLMHDLTKTLQTLLLLHDLANKDDTPKPKVVALPPAASRNELVHASGPPISLVTSQTQRGRK
jgi:hypothetical protein